MYMIFATFNALAFIHIFFTAPETKGRTLEEMDLVFDSRYKPWQKIPEGSRLDDLARDIEAGTVKVAAPVGGAGVGGITGEKHARHNDGVIAQDTNHLGQDRISNTQHVPHHDDEKAVGREHVTAF